MLSALEFTARPFSCEWRHKWLKRKKKKVASPKRANENGRCFSKCFPASATPVNYHITYWIIDLMLCWLRRINIHQYIGVFFFRPAQSLVVSEEMSLFIHETEADHGRTSFPTRGVFHSGRREPGENGGYKIKEEAKAASGRKGMKRVREVDWIIVIFKLTNDMLHYHSCPRDGVASELPFGSMRQRHDI